MLNYFKKLWNRFFGKEKPVLDESVYVYKAYRDESLDLSGGDAGETTTTVTTEKYGGLPLLAGGEADLVKTTFTDPSGTSKTHYYDVDTEETWCEEGNGKYEEPSKKKSKKKSKKSKKRKGKRK